ncbi:hypothetical protein MGWOODY_Smn1184 [hydrothermal vent metagenome]|uniref:Uncharacterized protein n=1 Tax=hydrothermal vent metagenome TaxID=652676 RepID=A0A160TJP4_9ZZZZ
MVLLPRRGLLAGAQADDHIADAHRLARLERDFARRAVPLVEQPDHRDTLRHRRRTERRVGPARYVDRHHVGWRLILVQRGFRHRLGAGRIGLPVAPADSEQRQDRRAAQQPAHHSGIQAS